MTVELGIIISLTSLALAVASFLLARRKENKTDGFELGKFMGEMKSEISSIKGLIEELKKDNKEFDDKMAKAIHEHELHCDDKVLRMIADHEIKYHNHN